MRAGFILILSFLVPENLDSGVRDFGGYYGWGRGVVGYTGAGKGGDHHVMV